MRRMTPLRRRMIDGADKGTGVNGIKGRINSVPGLALSEK